MEDYRRFTAKQEADKGINTLSGIIKGILSDSRVNQKEIDELKGWASDNEHLSRKEPFNEIIRSIQILTNGSIPYEEAMEDLLWIVEQYQDSNIYFNAVTADLQALQGYCHGLISDGQINQEEVEGLRKWIDQHEHLNRYYPYDELRSLLLDVLSDGIIDDEEKKVLRAYFADFVNLSDQELHQEIKNDAKGLGIVALCTSEPDIIVAGKSFCFTGALSREPRVVAQKRVIELGGEVHSSVKSDTNFLIVGDSGNPAWAFACYGRKVEKALELRKAGAPVVIVHEFSFFDAIDDL